MGTPRHPSPAFIPVCRTSEGWTGQSHCVHRWHSLGSVRFFLVTPACQRFGVSEEPVDTPSENEKKMKDLLSLTLSSNSNEQPVARRVRPTVGTITSGDRRKQLCTHANKERAETCHVGVLLLLVPFCLYLCCVWLLFRSTTGGSLMCSTAETRAVRDLYQSLGTVTLHSLKIADDRDFLHHQASRELRVQWTAALATFRTNFWTLATPCSRSQLAKSHVLQQAWCAFQIAVRTESPALLHAGSLLRPSLLGWRVLSVFLNFSQNHVFGPPKKEAQTEKKGPISRCPCFRNWSPEHPKKLISTGSPVRVLEEAEPGAPRKTFK